MKRKAQTFTTPAADEVARHLGDLIRQARLARRWTMADLAERARLGTATITRIEKGASSASLSAWLSALECLGLLPLLKNLQDPVAEALLNETRIQRARRRAPSEDLDF
jgi:transcriptional regulator with XRE-family HTH domain